MRPTSMLMVAGTAALAACAAGTDPFAPPPEPVPVERGRVVDGDPADVEARLRAAFEQAGFTLAPHAQANFVARTEAAEDAWANCPRTTIADTRGGKRRYRDASPENTIADVYALVQAAEDGGSHVMTTADFSQVQLNTFTVYTFKVNCQSTGVLEDLVLDAAEGTAPEG
ncbi:MAG: hypothetical protein ACFB3T_07270 [Geminicoccaceae bacterium]